MRQKEFQGFKTIGREISSIHGVHAYISKGHLSFGWTQKEYHVTLQKASKKKKKIIRKKSREKPNTFTKLNLKRYNL